MSKGLSYVLFTPYTIAKSRTGGVLSRLLSRTQLDLVGAQIFAPDNKFAEEYSALIRKYANQNQAVYLADYVEQFFGPSGGRPHRTLLLLFQGENPCEQLNTACGHLYSQHGHLDALTGETIRDTYADLIFFDDSQEQVRYFEPAVLTPRNQNEANCDLNLIRDFLNSHENIVNNMGYSDLSKIERTLVIIKPDNWTHHKSRPGTIIDMFSRTGLRIIGIKIHRFSLAQAMSFYGSVEGSLKKNLSQNYANDAKKLLEEKFGVDLDEKTVSVLTEDLGSKCAKKEFYKIIDFMAGKIPGAYSKEEMEKPGDVKCMILVYEGENAISKIRAVLGTTDPLKADDGTVRREFGSNIMVNSAHASDSIESYEREQVIVNINHNSVVSIINEHLSRQ